MILTDAGPLVALINHGDEAHERCVAVLGSLDGPMVTTWPAVSEAMYLLGSVGRWEVQEALWSLILRGDVDIGDLNEAIRRRMYVLMAKYRDLPMDLADASLVALAEARQLRQVFTLDSHFAVYRLFDRRRFDVVP